MNTNLPVVTHGGWLVLFSIGLVGTGFLAVANLWTGQWWSAVAMALVSLVEAVALAHVIACRRRVGSTR